MTIDDQKGRIIASVFELSSIIEDFQMQAAGGLMSGLDIWLFGLLPSLMTNTEMWTEILSDSLQSLEDIQHLLLQNCFLFQEQHHTLPCAGTQEQFIWKCKL